MAMDFLGSSAYLENAAPQWMVFPYHTSSDPAFAGRGLPPCNGKQILDDDPRPTSVAGFMCAWLSVGERRFCRSC